MKIIIEKYKDLADYGAILSLMEKKLKNVIDGGDQNIMLIEHKPVITGGTSSNDSELLQNDIPIYKVGRGGKFTYHGPGQRVIYPIMDLSNNCFEKDIRKYLDFLHDLIIKTLSKFSIYSYRRNDHIGVWVNENGFDSKIAAIGIRARKWVTYHGVAVNINPDLKSFKKIIPCGISDLGVTSLQKLGISVSIAEFDNLLIETIKELLSDYYDITYSNLS